MDLHVLCCISAEELFCQLFFDAFHQVRILPARNYQMEETLGSWRNLSTIVKIESIREIKDWITRNVRYYISDEKEPKVPIMQHWHWMSPSRRTNAGLAAYRFGTERQTEYETKTL